MSRPKGPKDGHWLLGQALKFKNDPLKFLTELGKEYPDITSFKFGPRNMYLLSNPEYIKHVMQTNNKKYRKGTKYEELKHFLGEGLLTSEGDFWRKQRRLAQPAFKRERIEGFAQTMIDYTYDMLEDWRKFKNKDFDLANEMMKLTLRVIGKTMLSVDFKNDAKDIGESISLLIEATNERIQTPFNIPMWVPVPKHLRYKKEKKKIDRIIFEIIEDRRKNGNTKGDLLDMLMEAEDVDTGEKMGDEQLRDEIATIFVAGHETTAIALTWSMYLICKHPEIDSKLKESVRQITQGNNKVTTGMVHQFGYALQIAEEAMRLYPPAWIMARKALEDDQIDGHNVYKGDDLLISTYQMHRSERFWENPEKFDPERFDDEKKKEYHKFLYFPFGGGPRLCIGNFFALMELQVILSVIYNETSLKLKEGFKPVMQPLVTLRPDKMLVNLETA